MAGVSCTEPWPPVLGGREHDSTTSDARTDRAPQGGTIVGLSQGTKWVRRLDLVARARGTERSLGRRQLHRRRSRSFSSVGISLSPSEHFKGPGPLSGTPA